MNNVQLANALFDSIESGDERRFLSLCTSDCRVLDTTEGSDIPIAREAQFLATLPGLFKKFKYAQRSYAATADGAVLQHSLQGESQSAHTVDLPIMIRMYVANGKVRRLEEYYDSSHTGAIYGDSPLRQFLQDMEKAFAKGPDAVNQFISPDLASCTLHPMYKSRDGFWKLEEALGKVFPDYTQTDTHYVEQGNLIVRRIVATQTHSGQFMGVPATGKKSTFEGFEMFEIIDGKIVRNWILPDTCSLLQQIGAFPATMNLGPRLGVDE
jgi:predicted ester cyclase/ketosteroid isomerase-like protein